MVRLQRILNYENGKIVLEYLYPRFNCVVYKNGRLVDSFGLEHKFYASKTVIDIKIAEAKSKHMLLGLSDDYTNAYYGGRLQYVFRGKNNFLYMMRYKNEKMCSEFQFNMIYEDLTFKDILEGIGVIT